jgi:hypothetical protein
MKEKHAHQHYKTFTRKQAENARCNWMEGLTNEQQRSENEDRYQQHPNRASTLKTKLRTKQQQRVTADILRQMVL